MHLQKLEALPVQAAAAEVVEAGVVAVAQVFPALAQVQAPEPNCTKQIQK